jgi:hypothetical protein
VISHARIGRRIPCHFYGSTHNLVVHDTSYSLQSPLCDVDYSGFKLNFSLSLSKTCEPMLFCQFIPLVSYPIVIAGANLDSSVGLCVIICCLFYDNPSPPSYCDWKNHSSTVTLRFGEDIVALFSDTSFLSEHEHLEQYAYTRMLVIGLHVFRCFMLH